MSSRSSNVALKAPGGVRRAFFIWPLTPLTVRIEAPSNLATSSTVLNIPCGTNSDSVALYRRFNSTLYPWCISFLYHSELRYKRWLHPRVKPTELRGFEWEAPTWMKQVFLKILYGYPISLSFFTTVTDLSTSRTTPVAARRKWAWKQSNPAAD